MSTTIVSVVSDSSVTKHPCLVFMSFETIESEEYFLQTTCKFSLEVLQEWLPSNC